jgi:hypothetical protein
MVALTESKVVNWIVVVYAQALIASASRSSTCCGCLSGKRTSILQSDRNASILWARP